MRFARVLNVEVADLFAFERRKRPRKPRPAKRKYFNLPFDAEPPP
jgi:hypothetical protein